MRGRETKPSDKTKQCDENDQSGPIDVGHGISSPVLMVFWLAISDSNLASARR
jgi:hypothetical protein